MSPRTPAESIDAYLEDAITSRQAAMRQYAKREWPVMLINRGRVAGRHFMRALVGWRTGLLDPVRELETVVEYTEETLAIVATRELDQLAPIVNVLPAVYSGLLLGTQAPQADREFARRSASGPIDATLEARLVSLLRGDPPVGRVPTKPAKRVALLIETFRAYEALATADREAEREPLALAVVELFEQRERDEYFEDGPSWNGGGPDNDRVPDFRLAAIWKVRQFPPPTDPRVQTHVMPGALPEHDSPSTEMRNYLPPL